MTANYCCLVCPHQPTCADLNEAAFARPEEITLNELEAFFAELEEDLPAPGPVCPVHYIELPATGVCESCL